MNRKRVLLADDRSATMQLWRSLIEPEFEVIGTVNDGEALVDAAERLAPDVIVTDVVMPRMSGIAAAGVILRRHPAARIVFATVHADRTMLRRGLAVGALGDVLKVRAGDDIVPAIRAALKGELHISPFPPSRMGPRGIERSGRLALEGYRDGARELLERARGSPERQGGSEEAGGCRGQGPAGRGANTWPDELHSCWGPSRVARVRPRPRRR